MFYSGQGIGCCINVESHDCVTLKTIEIWRLDEDIWISSTPPDDNSMTTQDNCIRIVRAKESHVAFQALADGPVSALCSSNAIGEGVDQVSCVLL